MFPLYNLQLTYNSILNDFAPTFDHDILKQAAHYLLNSIGFEYLKGFRSDLQRDFGKYFQKIQIFKYLLLSFLKIAVKNVRPHH